MKVVRSRDRLSIFPPVRDAPKGEGGFRNSLYYAVNGRRCDGRGGGEKNNTASHDDGNGGSFRTWSAR